MDPAGGTDRRPDLRRGCLDPPGRGRARRSLGRPAAGVRLAACACVAAAICLESGDGPNTTATDAANPSLGQVFYYLTRARNLCPKGVGPLGTDGNGNPITGVSCP